MEKNAFNMIKKHLVLLALSVLIFIPKGVTGQIRFRLRPYVGAGVGLGMQSHVPVFEIGNESDQDYYDLNLASLKSTWLRFQTRLNIFQWGHLSLGYLFWNHSVQYADEFPGSVVITNRPFPHSYFISVHGGGLQWDFHRNPSVKTFPFITAGAGSYYGSFKVFEQSVEDLADPVATKIVTQAMEYQGTAAFIGVGVVFFKYGYLYVGYMDLLKDNLPTRQYVDVVLGVTF